MQSQLTILRTYALMDPEEIPDSVKLWYSEDTVTIHDKYPKGLYHELVLPLIRPPLRAADLKDLRSLLLLPREQAKGVLLKLRRDALETKRLIEKEMVTQHTATWPVHIGVHALPSLEHLHVHVVSSDFLGEYFKRKKNLNSFHPKLGFFIHLDEIIRWFDADIEPTWFAMKATIDKKEYEPLVRTNTRCPLCDAPYTSSPRLRRHLEEHFEATKAAEHQRRVQEMIDAIPDEPEPEPDRSAAPGSRPVVVFHIARGPTPNPAPGPMAGVRTGGKRTFSEYAGRVELPPPAMNWDDPPEEGPLRWRDGRAEKRPRPPPEPIDLTGEETGTAEAPIDLTSEHGASSVGPSDLTGED